MFIKKISHSTIAQTLLFIAGFTISIFTQAATLTASVDRDTIGLNETIVLTIKVDEQSKSLPDFSSLKNDFDILSNQRSSSIQVVNGSAESSTDWQLTLSPKRAGTLLIPSFNVDNDVSDAIAIKVSSQQQSQQKIDSGNNDKVRTSIELDKTSAYVQEQILVKIKLITEVNLSQAEMQPLELKNALVINLDQKQYQTTINGTPHLVVETSFAIFPQASGDLVIPSLSYTVSVENQRSVWGDPFGRNRGNILRLRTDEQRITINAAPTSNANQSWQPANQLSLSETWSASLDSAKIGEPITRTITIHTDGLSSGQIAPLKNQDVAGLTFYPDQAQIKDSKTPDGIQGSRTETIAIVPNAGGDYELPAVNVNWWDNKTQQMQTASLPAKTIHVLGQPAITNTQINAAPPAPASTPLPLPVESMAPVIEDKNKNIPAWLLAILVVFIVLSAGLIFYILKLKSFITNAQAKHHNSDAALQAKEKDIWQALKSTAATNNATEFRKAVLQWASFQWPQQHITTLDDIAKLGQTQAFTEQLHALDKALYGNQESSDWDATALLKLMNEYRKQKKSEKKSSELKQLYNQ